MSKGIKFKDNIYLDSSSVIHNRKQLDSILDDVVPTFSTSGDWTILTIGKAVFMMLNGKNITYTNGSVILPLPLTLASTNGAVIAMPVWNNTNGYINGYIMGTNTIKLNMMTGNGVSWSGTNMTSVLVVGQLP